MIYDRVGIILVGWKLPDLVSAGPELIPEGWTIRDGALCLIELNDSPRIGDALLTLRSSTNKEEAWKLALELGVTEDFGPGPQLIVATKQKK